MECDGHVDEVILVSEQMCVSVSVSMCLLLLFYFLWSVPSVSLCAGIVFMLYEYVYMRLLLHI